MKFRAVMVDAGPMREFTNIVATISKLSKECTLRLSNDKLYFIVSDENSGPGPPVLWCEVPQNTFFSEYQMIGVDDEHPEIFLAVPSVNLARALSTLKSAKSIKIKLTRKQCPCLTLEVELPSVATMQLRHVTHDIPVTVIPRKQWSEFKEPSYPQPNISIQLPALKQLRSTVERMRSMSSDLIMGASKQGVLVLQIKTDSAKVSTRFTQLPFETHDDEIQSQDVSSQSQLTQQQLKLCRVDIKKLLMYLNADQISQNRTICSIVQEKCIAMRLDTEEHVRLHCVIPGLVY